MQSGTTSQRSDEATFLQDLGPGKARLLFTGDVNAALESLEFSLDEFAGNFPVIVISWRCPLRIDLGIAEVVDQLAESALSAWPDWTQGIDQRWQVAAESLAQVGIRPIPPEYPPASQVKNLAAVLPPNLLILLALTDHTSLNETIDPRLDGLCRTASWLAQNADAKVGVLVNESLGGRVEFASIDYEPIHWPTETLAHESIDETLRPGIAGANRDPSNDVAGTSRSGSANQQSTENKLRFWPILDRPHPNSPGEQALAQALSNDTELAGLFRFNQLFATSEGHRYIVDLLNRQDQIVIEIDGYRHHRSRVAFNSDRLRDYHVFLTGYVVLRIPHEEVVRDIVGVMQRIHRFVNFRRRRSHKESIADDPSIRREGKRTTS